MRPGPSAPVSTSDIEDPHVLRVLLDELAPGLDLVAHQLREDLVRERRVLDLDPDKHALRRVHRRLAELARVHLAEALEAADLQAVLREVQRRRLQLAEGLGGAVLLADRDAERRPADRKSTRLNS